MLLMGRERAVTQFELRRLHKVTRKQQQPPHLFLPPTITLPPTIPFYVSLSPTFF